MVKIVQMGLGPIGQKLTRYLAEREGITIVGAVDPDPQKAGQDVGSLAGLKKSGVTVSSDLTSAVRKGNPVVALISTVSSLKKVEAQIKEAADLKLNIVSTCEELSHPFHTQPDIARRIDAYCKDHGIACVGTGVNPGFLMDYLPAVLTSVCRNVEHIKVERYQDARHRRVPFQKKIGAGLTIAEFREKIEDIRHIGLPESTYLLADALNIKLDRVEETLDPVLAETRIELENLTIKKGNVAGVRQVAKGYWNNEEIIHLDFKAAVGLDESHDTIRITGEPGFTSTIAGGINGDIATCAVVVNAIGSISKATPGLKTMLDIPVPSCFRSM